MRFVGTSFSASPFHTRGGRFSDGLHSNGQRSDAARNQRKLHRAFEQSRAADEVDKQRACQRQHQNNLPTLPTVQMMRFAETGMQVQYENGANRQNKTILFFFLLFKGFRGQPLRPSENRKRGFRRPQSPVAFKTNAPTSRPWFADSARFPHFRPHAAARVRQRRCPLRAAYSPCRDYWLKGAHP